MAEKFDQEFELGLSVDGHAFDYLMHIEQKADYEKPRIIKERALATRNCYSHGIWTAWSSRRPTALRHFSRWIGDRRRWLTIQPRGVNLSKLALLQEEIAKLLILRPNPRSMERESKAEVRYPDLSMTNLTSWYRSLAQEQEWTDALRDALQDVWPDFRSFKLVDAGLNTKALQLRFESEAGNQCCSSLVSFPMESGR